MNGSNGGTGPVDLALVAELDRIVAIVDPEPAYLRELGRAALAVRRVDAETAALVADSAQLADLVRSTATHQPRMLAFELDGVTIDVEAAPGDSGFRLVGQVDGLADIVVIDVETASAATLTAEVDGWGRFVVTGVPPGLVRLRVVAAGRDLSTDWVRLR